MEFVAGVDMIVAGLAMVQDASADDLTHPELLAQLDRLKSVAWTLPTVEHPLLARLASEADPQALGGTSLADVLSTRLRISKDEARRRIKEAADLGPRTAFTGEPLDPVLPHTTAAQARGQIGAEYVRIIRKFFHELPANVDYQTRELAEADLARVASGFKPEELRQVADRMMMLVHPDGDFSDAERARRRHLTLGKQDADGMSKISGQIDPETRATLDAVLAKWAAPGMCNPDDETPCVDGEPGEDTARRDTRSQSQRNHAALNAGCEISHS